jgi:hypothetical protein
VRTATLHRYIWCPSSSPTSNQFPNRTVTAKEQQFTSAGCCKITARLISNKNSAPDSRACIGDGTPHTLVTVNHVQKLPLESLRHRLHAAIYLAYQHIRIKLLGEAPGGLGTTATYQSPSMRQSLQSMGFPASSIDPHRLACI